MEGARRTAAARLAGRAIAWAAALATCAALAPAALATTWPLHASGTQIVDAQGQPVQLHSVQVIGMSGGSGNSKPDACGQYWAPPPSQDPVDIAADGFNAVRLSIAWAVVEPTAPTVDADGSLTHTWNQPYLSALDSLVDAFTSRGVGVVLEMHQSQWSPAFTNFTASGKTVCEGSGMPTWLYPDAVPGQTPQAAKCEFFRDQARSGVPEGPQEGLAAAWQMLAARYADEPGVIGADIVNEPGWGAGCAATGSDLQAFYALVGSAIASANPDMLLVYEDGTYQSYLEQGFLMPGPPALQNAVYSLHFYPDDWSTTTSGTPPTTGEQQLTAWWQHVQTLDVPLYVGELNAFNEGFTNPKKHTDQNWDADTAAMLDFCRTNGIGWSFWAYEPGSGSSLLSGRNRKVKKPLLTALQGGF